MEWPSLFLRQPSCCAPPTRQLTLSPAVTCACPREPPLRNRPRARGVNCDRYQSRTRDGKGIFIPHIAVLQREEEYDSSKFATLSDRQSRHFGYRGRNRLPYRSEAEKNLDSTSLARLAPDGPQSAPLGRNYLHRTAERPQVQRRLCSSPFGRHWRSAPNFRRVCSRCCHSFIFRPSEPRINGRMPVVRTSPRLETPPANSVSRLPDRFRPTQGSDPDHVTEAWRRALSSHRWVALSSPGQPGVR